MNEIEMLKLRAQLAYEFYNRVRYDLSEGLGAALADAMINKPELGIDVERITEDVGNLQLSEMLNPFLGESAENNIDDEIQEDLEGDGAFSQSLVRIGDAYAKAVLSVGVGDYVHIVPARASESEILHELRKAESPLADLVLEVGSPQ